MVEKEMIGLGLIPNYGLNFQESKYTPYWFEESDLNVNRLWLRKQMPICALICFLYVLFAVLGPRFMKDRKPFDLQLPLTIWNFSFAAFSFVLVVRTLPMFIDSLTEPNGFHQTACGPVAANEVAGFYAFIFALSKVFELGDTVFIVLRKKPILFLHWFHHVTVLYISWFAFSEAEPYSAWPAIINAAVHSIMYTYFGIMSLKIKLSKKLAMTITTIQIAQFVVDFFVNVYGVIVLAAGGECFRTPASIKFYAAATVAYFVLFCKYYYGAYIVKPKPKLV